jgi:hypothetical protein
MGSMLFPAASAGGAASPPNGGVLHSSRDDDTTVPAELAESSPGPVVRENTHDVGSSASKPAPETTMGLPPDAGSSAGETRLTRGAGK